MLYLCIDDACAYTRTHKCHLCIHEDVPLGVQTVSSRWSVNRPGSCDHPLFTRVTTTSARKCVFPTLLTCTEGNATILVRTQGLPGKQKRVAKFNPPA